MRTKPRVPVDLVEVTRRKLDRWAPIPATIEEAQACADALNADLALDSEDAYSAETVMGWWAEYEPTGDEARDGLASAVVHEVLEVLSAPGPRSWRRHHWVRRVSSWLYVSGITYSGGSSQMGGIASYPGSGWVYSLPRWSHVLPRRGGRLRPYVLGLPDWWWHCQLTQGRRLRDRHRPYPPAVLGICGRCAPWPCCGAPGWDHAENCTTEQRIEAGCG